MNELVFLRHNEPYTTSTIIAERAGIKHHAVRQMIQRHEASLKAFGVLAFEMRKPEKGSAGGRPEMIYRLNEMQALLLFTFLRNTPAVIAFKTELIRQFCAMRALLAEQKSTFWKETQRAGREVRKGETDVIKSFVTYAEQHGSRNAGRYYVAFSALANRAAGVKERKLADTAQLSIILLVEKIIGQAILDGMARGEPYKAIYQSAKQKAEQLCLLAASPQITGKAVKNHARQCCTSSFAENANRESGSCLL